MAEMFEEGYATTPGLRLGLRSWLAIALSAWEHHASSPLSVCSIFEPTSPTHPQNRNRTTPSTLQPLHPATPPPQIPNPSITQPLHHPSFPVSFAPPVPAPSVTWAQMEKWPKFPHVKMWNTESRQWDYALVNDLIEEKFVSVEFAPGEVIGRHTTNLFDEVIDLGVGRLMPVDTPTLEDATLPSTEDLVQAKGASPAKKAPRPQAAAGRSQPPPAARVTPQPQPVVPAAPPVVIDVDALLQRNQKLLMDLMRSQAPPLTLSPFLLSRPAAASQPPLNLLSASSKPPLNFALPNPGC